MAKTKAQLEKKKREIEKRKKTEKAILKIAAAMPDGHVAPEPISQSPESGPTQAKA